MIVRLTDMGPGETGVVTEIAGGAGATGRIRSMGVRVGKKIKKTGSQFRRGPQTVVIDNFKIAIGFGMAEKILVEVEM